MSQSRIQDYGSPVTAASIKALTHAFCNAAILSGNGFFVAGPSLLGINPGAVITNQGVIIEESEIKYLSITSSTNPADYTVYYAQVDQNVSGGVPAVLTLATGLLTAAAVQGVILGYVRYPGNGVALDPSYFVQPVALHLGSSAPTLYSADWIVPISNQGYLVTAASGGSLTITNAFDTTGTYGVAPQVYLMIRNNTLTVGTTSLVFPFKVKDLPFAQLQMIVQADVNATMNATFIDSEGASTLLTASPISGLSVLTYQSFTIPLSTVQTPNTIVYVMFELQENPNRQILIQALGLSPYNLPV